ncbi:MAG TPA: type II secretion system protein GspG [Pirellulales bacterium]
MNRRPARRREDRAAFTLMEVLLVLVILVVLGSLAVSVYTGVRKNALHQAAQVQVNTLSDDCQLYYNDMNAWPSDLKDLRVDPTGGSGAWHGPYSDRELDPDPWGNAYMYDADGKTKHNGDKPDIWSNGAPNDPTGPIYNK